MPEYLSLGVPSTELTWLPGSPKLLPTPAIAELPADFSFRWDLVVAELTSSGLFSASCL